MTKKGLISMILGIVSMVLGITCYGGYIGLACGIAAIILGNMATQIDELDKKAKLGKIFGIVGIILSVVGVVISIVLAVGGGILKGLANAGY